MEYEIGDDPQGLPDRPEGDRDGGLRGRRAFFRKGAPSAVPDRIGEAPEDDAALEQMGEAA